MCAKSVILTYTSRMRAALVYGILVLIGIGGGFGLFFASSFFIPDPPPNTHSPEKTYRGVVTRHAISEKTLEISVASNFPLVNSLPVRFTYDENTRWWFSEYLFRGQVNEKKISAATVEKPLPVNTVVRLTWDAKTGGPLHAEHIVIFKRSEL